MTLVLAYRKILFAGIVPLLLCALVWFALDARMALGASPAPDAALARCFATLGAATQFSSADASAVQQAVDAAGPGALVKVAGTCAGVQARSGTRQTVLIAQRLSVQGGYTVGNWLLSDPLANPTILDAQARGRVISSSVGLSVTNLTVQNGLVLCSELANCFYPNAFHLGGGIYAGAGLTLSQVSVISSTADCGNSAECYGGGVFVAGGATVSGSLFQNNLCAGGLICSGGGMYVTPTAILTGTEFLANTASGGGGGLSAISATVSGGLFQSNQCTNNLCFGGGLGALTVAVTSTRFLSNSAMTRGGALASFFGGSLHQSCFSGNRYPDGVYNDSITVTLDATNNWWGAPDGPAPAGHGDRIDGNVSANPYLTTPVFACPSFLGHQLYLPIIVR